MWDIHVRKFVWSLLFVRASKICYAPGFRTCKIINHDHRTFLIFVYPVTFCYMLLISLSSRSQWPRRLKRRFAAAHSLGLRLRTRRGHGYLSVVSVVLCQVEVSATGRSLFQRSSTDRGVTECNLDTSRMGRPRPTRAVEAWREKQLKLHPLKFTGRAFANGGTLTIKYLPNANASIQWNDNICTVPWVHSLTYFSRMRDKSIII